MHLRHNLRKGQDLPSSVQVSCKLGFDCVAGRGGGVHTFLSRGPEVQISSCKQ